MAWYSTNDYIAKINKDYNSIDKKRNNLDYLYLYKVPGN